nr:hypothetical protein [Nostoc sp. EfeVER01]
MNPPFWLGTLSEQTCDLERGFPNTVKSQVDVEMCDRIYQWES